LLKNNFAATDAFLLFAPESNAAAIGDLLAVPEHQSIGETCRVCKKTKQNVILTRSKLQQHFGSKQMIDPP
jgi:hypothetical protein